MFCLVSWSFSMMHFIIVCVNTTLLKQTYCSCKMPHSGRPHPYFNSILLERKANQRLSPQLILMKSNVTEGTDSQKNIVTKCGRVQREREDIYQEVLIRERNRKREETDRETVKELEKERRRERERERENSVTKCVYVCVRERKRRRERKNLEF